MKIAIMMIIVAAAAGRRLEENNKLIAERLMIFPTGRGGEFSYLLYPKCNLIEFKIIDCSFANLTRGLTNEEKQSLKSKLFEGIVFNLEQKRIKINLETVHKVENRILSLECEIIDRNDRNVFKIEVPDPDGSVRYKGKLLSLVFRKPLRELSAIEHIHSTINNCEKKPI